MQVQTLTITTERQQAGGDLFKITSFEMKIEAFCDLCGNSASGTNKALQNSGWHLGCNEQFCPECN